MQQPWRSIRVVVLRFVHKWIFNGVFFPLCVLHCRYEYTEKRKGGNINYQVVERRDTVNTREDTKRGKKGEGRYGRSFVRQAPAVVRHWNLWYRFFAAICQGESRNSAMRGKPWRNISRRYYARYDKNNTRKITVPRRIHGNELTDANRKCVLLVVRRRCLNKYSRIFRDSPWLIMES